MKLNMKLGVILAATITAVGADTPVISTKAANNGDWCSWLQSKPGALYKNAENPFISLIQFGGRFQWQAASVDGKDVNGLDYDNHYDDFRRVRFETKVDLFRYFSINSKINMVNDERRSGGDLDWGYDSFDELIFSFDIKKGFELGDLDILKIKYGRQKFNFTEEVHMSSKDIFTLERSAIANKLYGVNSRPTGLTVDLAKGPWSGTLGVFSGDDVEENIGGWNYGEAYYLSVGYEQSDDLRYVWDFLHNNAAGGQDTFGYEWATSFAAVYENDRFGMIANLMLGDNGDTANGNGAERQGSFHGLVIMPWYWIVPEKLQAVTRYQYQGSSESEGIRLNSRYVRSQHDDPAVDVNRGRGDAHHSIYVGLNYLLCGDNAKIMSGVEFDHLNTLNGSAQSMSYFIGFRSFF
jgi:hypothetical protein